jgi:nitrate/nitrite transporter NarK
MVGYMVMMVVIIALTLVFVKTMGLKSGNPTPGYLAINVIYSFLAAAIGGWVTARIAEFKPMIAAGALAILMAVMGVLSYRHYAGQQPFWYQVMMMVAPSLCALGGAALYARNRPARN